MSELNIPESWAEAKLEEIFDVNPRNKIEDDFTEVTFVPMNSVNQYTAKIESTETRPWGKVKKGYTHFRNGDIIFAKITPCMENKKSSLAETLCNGYGAGSTEFHVLRPPKEIFGKFALHFVRSGIFLEDAAKNMSGTAGQKRVPTTWLNQYSFPLPPQNEQIRIVQKIESCFAKIDATEANLNKVETLLEKYRESLLAKAFRGELVPQDPNDEPASVLLEKIRKERSQNAKGKKAEQEFAPIADEDKPFELPMGWEWVRLSDLIEIINGRAYKQNELLDKGTPVLRVGNLFTSEKWYYSNLELDPDKYIEKGDFIFAWSASFGPFIWAGEKVIYHYHIWKFKLYHESEILKDYLYFFLLSESERIKKSSKGIAMAHLTKAGMEQYKVPLPPLSEQMRIVSKLKELNTNQNNVKLNVAAISKMISLIKDSLLQKAFEGRLVEQIPTEGTGHELLAKILAEKEATKDSGINEKSKKTLKKAPAKRAVATKGK